MFNNTIFGGVISGDVDLGPQILPNDVSLGPAAHSMISLIVPGTGLNQRIGKKIVVVNIKVSAVFSIRNNNPADVIGTNYSPTMRWLLVKDKQCNGGAAAVSDVLWTTAGSIPKFVNNLPTTWVKNPINEDRFEIMEDIKMSPPMVSDSGASGPVILEKDINCRCEVMYAEGTDGNIALVKSTNLFMMAMSDQFSDPENACSFTCYGSWKITYDDS